MMRRLTFLLLLGVAACAGPRPAVPPAASVVSPDKWRIPSPVGADVDPAWWQAFGDPSLSDLVERALAHNDDIAIAASRVEQARAQFQISKAQRLPSLTASASGGRDRHVDAFGQDVDETAGQGGLTISYDLDLFGRLRNASAAARARLLGSQAARDSVRLAVAAATAQGYVNLLALDAKLSVARQTLVTRDIAFKTMQRRADAGYSTQLELRQAEAEYRATEQLIPEIQLAIHRQEDGLSLLIGEAPGEIARGKSLDSLSVPSAVAVLPSTLLRRRPDITEAEQQIVAADRSLDAVRASFLPDVQLNGTGGFVASTLLMTNPLSVFSIGGGILETLFDGGRRRAEQRGSAAQRDAAAFAYRKTVLNAFRETEDALAGVALSGDQQVAIEKERDAVSRLLTLAQNRYRAGYSPYLEQVDAERSLLQADLSLVQVRAAHLSSYISLYQALGGGWSLETANLAAR